MAAEQVQFKDAVCIVDWSVVRTILRSWINADSMLRCSKVQSHPGDGWWAPTITQYETDWDAVRARTLHAMGWQFPQWKSRFLKRGWHEAKDDLRQKLIETRGRVASYHKLSHDAQKTSMDAINKKVGNLETGLRALTDIREGSTDVLLVGSLFIDGPALVAVKGAQAIMKASVEYQKHERWKSAVVVLATTFAVSFIPAPKGTDGKALIIIKVVGKGLADGAASAGTAIARLDHVTTSDCLHELKDGASEAAESIASGAVGYKADKLVGKIGESIQNAGGIQRSVENAAKAAEGWAIKGTRKLEHSVARDLLHSHAARRLLGRAHCRFKLTYHHLRSHLTTAYAHHRGDIEKGIDRLAGYKKKLVEWERNKETTHYPKLGHLASADEAKQRTIDLTAELAKKHFFPEEQANDDRDHREELQRMPHAIHSAVLLDDILLSKAIIGPSQRF